LWYTHAALETKEHALGRCFEKSAALPEVTLGIFVASPLGRLAREGQPVQEESQRSHQNIPTFRRSERNLIAAIFLEF